ncbi:MAG: M42 family metallopeptidase [Paludibacteraceae bacterium]|nr:M42 family metallopeptidase [Paludibacteraceae bacterium]
MNEKLYKFFIELLNTPSPSGYEGLLMNKFRDFMMPYVDEITTDAMGNLIAHKKGNPEKRVMIESHADEIGLMVTYIDKKGYLYFKPLGGIDANILPGIQVTVHGPNGPVVGIIGKKPIHLFTPTEREKPMKMEDMWIDISAENKEKAEEMVEIGSPVTFRTPVVEMSNGLIASKSLDDKAGLTVVAGVAQQLAENGIETDMDLYFVAAVQEELGTRGVQPAAYGINPLIGIALDVTHATDYPGVPAEKFGDFKMNGGAVVATGPNICYKLSKTLKEISKQKGIKCQSEAIPRATSTDARTIQLVHEGVLTGLVSIPCRYMHTPNEVVSTNDIQSAIDMISEFCKQDVSMEEYAPLNNIIIKD